MLAAALAGSMAAGVLLPKAGLVLAPYLLVWLGALLFFNLLRLDTRDVVTTFSRPRRLAGMAAIKLVGMPLVMYLVAYVLYRPFALPILLLSGISTGLGAPFIANLVGARLPLIVSMIVVTSLAAPFTLPALTFVLAGSQFQIPIVNMITLLAAALLIPIAAGWGAKKYLPRLSGFAERNSFPMSIVFVVLINFAMFAEFSGYFYSQQVFLLQTIVTSFLCFGVYALVGYFAVHSKRSAAQDESRQERLSGVISMTHVNNVLVAVFASQFFGAQVAALAALYNVPYYVGILLIKLL